MIPSIGTSVANETFKSIFGDSFQTTLAFQLLIINNNGQLPT